MSEKDKINDHFYRDVMYYEDHYLNFFKALKPAV